ncbi:MAG: VOC family protein [Zoogloeaceae bacterium]|nr:VOC family protein [Rhodocyclaceae bacterium]MCP5234073.1 VOC family protein [Zoogloeaceae bacterium]MCP5254850.1 VOC family protein [Zoogloeaceae bacterium]MCP5295558.1 VOC family protein [Zoogloeaceae bacterium]MCW5617594.1 VOC family protein [Rhodocyclaceae bacterium]
MSYPGKSYLEHVAVRVHDIHWHIRFFREVLGMPLRECDGPTDNPRQVWTMGGVQLVATPGFEAPPSNAEGWLAHFGIMVEDLEAVLKEAASWGVKELPQGPNWLQLPDGLALELMQATGNAVAEVLAVDPRA